LHAHAGDAASAKPHYHESHETAIYMLEGVSEFLHVPNFEFRDLVEAGDYNPTDKPARALIARTGPNEQESVVLLGS
jgi:uncharacterized RmlC-like cupin family protein